MKSTVTTMDVGQKLRRMKHNLVNFSRKDDDDELKAIGSLEQRNAKVINAISVYKKDVASTIRTGLKEENVDKRRKKLEEFNLASDLREMANELESAHTTCLHKVTRKIADVIQHIVNARVKHDVMLECRVLSDLSQFQELEKQLTKSREKLSNAYTDLDIAQKAQEKADGPTASHQEAVDMAQLKLENQKDNLITDVFLLATKEQAVAKSFVALLDEQFEYHRSAMIELQKILPEVRKDIENASPRPVFGVDLEDHLRHYQCRQAVVIEKCCTMLRRCGFSEKGIFRVNGNNSKIRRMKAAFDAGQVDLDEKIYLSDPNSVGSVLKCYLRELPDPLLTRKLQNDWCAAARLDGEERLRALEVCVANLPQANFDNLTYLMHFLNDLLARQNVTSMNASNLAIVMGPNLLGCDVEGSNNSLITKVVEILLLNAHRFFGIPEDVGSRRSPYQDAQDSQYSKSDSFRGMGSSLTGSIRVGRPKEKAPPPPASYDNVAANDLIDLADTWGSTSSNELRNEVDYKHDAPRPDRARTFSEESDDFDDYGFDDEDGSISRSAADRPHRPPLPAFRQLSDALSQNRPMSYHMAVGGSVPEPSATIAVAEATKAAPSPPERKRMSMVVSNPMAIRPWASKTQAPPHLTAAPPEATPPVVANGGNNRTVVNVDGSASQRSKPPLPAKPKPDFDKESSRL